MALLSWYLSMLVVLVLLIGAIVYFTDPFKSLNRAFAVFALGAVVWIASTAFDPLIHSQRLAEGLATVAYLCGALIALTFLHMSYLFYPERIPYWLWSASGLLALVFLTLIAIPRYLAASVVLHALPNGYHDVLHGPGFGAYAALFLGTMLWGFAVLGMKLRASAGEERRSLQLLFWGTLALFPITAYSVFFRSFTTEQELVWAGPSCMAVWIVAMLLAIRKYHLLHADLFASEVLIFLSMCFALLQFAHFETLMEFSLKLVIFVLLMVAGMVVLRFSILRRQEHRASPHPSC